MEIKLTKNFTKRLKGKTERYEFEVGILENAPHRIAESASAGLVDFAGGPTRKKQEKTKHDLNYLSRKWQARENYLRAPFKNKNNKDILAFIKVFFEVITGNESRVGQGGYSYNARLRRLTNLLQAIVRNPILRLDYGRNSEEAIKRKSFDRLMIDTGQFFRGIKARVIIKVFGLV